MRAAREGVECRNVMTISEIAHAEGVNASRARAGRFDAGKNRCRRGELDFMFGVVVCFYFRGGGVVVWNVRSSDILISAGGGEGGILISAFQWKCLFSRILLDESGIRCARTINAFLKSRMSALQEVGDLRY